MKILIKVMIGTLLLVESSIFLSSENIVVAQEVDANPSSDVLFNEADFQFTETNGQITITGTTQEGGLKLYYTKGNLVIPEKLNNLPVVRIEESAFNSKAISALTLPNTLTSIGYGSFVANDIESLIIPDSVVEIETAAFSNNKTLKSIEFGSGLRTIGYSAFLNNNITSLIIPSSVTSIGDNAFFGTIGYIKYDAEIIGRENFVNEYRYFHQNANVFRFIGDKRYGSFDWSTSLPHTAENYVYSNGEYDNTKPTNPVSNEAYFRYPINVSYNLDNGLVFESGFTTDLITDVSSSGWTDYTYLTVEDLNNKLNQLKITVPSGYEISSWNIVNKEIIRTYPFDSQLYINNDVIVEPVLTAVPTTPPPKPPTTEPNINPPTTETNTNQPTELPETGMNFNGISMVALAGLIIVKLKLMSKR